MCYTIVVSMPITCLSYKEQYTERGLEKSQVGIHIHIVF